MTGGEQKVLAMLAALAQQSGEQITEFRLEFVMKRMLAIGTHDAICEGLAKLLESSRRFPTVAEVKDAMGVKDLVSDRGQALIAAAAIEAALTTPAKRSREAMGQLAWLTCQRLGGIQHLCDVVTYDNMTYYQHEFRTLAEALIESAKAGSLDTMPGLPAGPAHLAIEGLAAQFSLTEAKKSPTELEWLKTKRELLRRNAADDGGNGPAIDSNARGEA